MTGERDDMTKFPEAHLLGRRQFSLLMLAGAACPATALAGGKVGSGRSFEVSPGPHVDAPGGEPRGQVATGPEMPETSSAGTPARVGDVRSAIGSVFAQVAEARPLTAGAGVMLGDLVWTNAASRAELAMLGGSNVFLGANARLKVDRFVAESGGRLVLGEGALVFDRDDALPKTDVEVQSVFGLIGVRGTRFFAGPNRGSFAVFCERGEVHVRAGGERRVLRPGDGIDIAKPGAAPSKVKQWGKARIDEAFSSVLR